MYKGYTTCTRAYFNLFLAWLWFYLDLKGKTLAEKSKLMGETWRNLSTSDKEKYAEGGDISDDMETELTPDEKRRRIIRVARRLQGDVSCTIIYT